MKTISVFNESGTYAGEMGVDCKPATKVSRPTRTKEGLEIPAGMTGKQLKAWKAKQAKLEAAFQTEDTEDSKIEGDKRKRERVPLKNKQNKLFYFTLFYHCPNWA